MRNKKDMKNYFEKLFNQEDSKVKYNKLKPEINFSQITNEKVNNQKPLYLFLKSKMALNIYLIIIFLIFSFIIIRPTINNSKGEPNGTNSNDEVTISSYISISNEELVRYFNKIDNDSSTEELELEFNNIINTALKYNVQYTDQIKYYVAYLDQHIVDELYDLWKLYNYIIRPLEVSAVASSYYNDLVDDEEFIDFDNSSLINKNKITGSLLLFINNILGKENKYISKINWLEYSDDKSIMTKVDNQVPIAVIANKKMKIDFSKDINLDNEKTFDAYFFYSYYIDNNINFLIKNNEYNSWLDSLTTNEQVLSIPFDLFKFNENLPLNKIYPLYFNKLYIEKFSNK